MVVTSSFHDQRHRQTAVISDILSWLQALSIYTAILVSPDTTTKVWSELPWVGSSKRHSKVGEMNFSIYGRCLTAKQLSTILPVLWAKAWSERPLPRCVPGGMMGSTMTAPLAAFITTVVFVGEATRPEDVPKHQSMPKGSDMLITYTFTLLLIHIHMLTMYIVLVFKTKILNLKRE